MMVFAGIVIMGALFCAAVVVGGTAGARRFERSWRLGIPQAWAAERYSRLVPPRLYSWQAIERKALRALVSAVEISVSGRVRVPARIEIRVSDDDWRALEGVTLFVQAGLVEVIVQRGRDQGWEVPSDLAVTLAPDRRLRNGRPRVSASHAVVPVPSVFVPALRTEPRTAAGTPPASAAPDLEVPVLVPDATGPMPDLGPVTAPRAVATLVSLDPGSHPSIVIGPADDVVEIGRSHGAGVGDVPTVSATHARVERTVDGWQICDAGSRNGTLVNEHRVDQSIVGQGDTVQLGFRGPRYAFVVTTPTAVYRGPLAPVEGESSTTTGRDS